MSDVQSIRYVVEFTRVYKECGEKHLREARCLDLQLRQIALPLKQEDWLAGMVRHELVGFSSQFGGIYTYFFHEHEFLSAMDRCQGELDEATHKAALAACEFWRLENTAKKHNMRFVQKYGFEPPHNFYTAGIANCDSRVAGTNVDFHKLIDLGLPGLRQEIAAAVAANGASDFYTGLIQWIDTLCAVALRYADQAQALYDEGGDAHHRVLAQALRGITEHAPRSFVEGLQLMWLYSVCCDLMNYGRMDDYLGALYLRDIERGTLDEEEAVRYVLKLYKHFLTINKIHDCRVIVGGRGRRNVEGADRLAIVIMEASRRFRQAVPQLTLRYHKGMDEAVFAKAMQVNAEGCTFPILYSDETNIPAVMKVYGVPEREAEQYVPFGCGEYVLVGMSVGTPNNGVNLLKALEATLHDGFDPWFHQQIGTHTGKPEDFASYEVLYDALLTQLAGPVEQVAYHKWLNYRVAGEEAAYLHLSLLMDDCIARGKAVLSGGVRYENASSEIFGLISCADGLAAIKRLVYDEKKYTLPQVVEMLDRNWEGHEADRKAMLAAPKYGNDDAYTDAIATRLFADIADLTAKAGEKVGLHRYNIVSVNNSMSAEWGYFCEASPCGRRRGDAMANANGPSLGADRSGMTALLNSMAKFDNTKHVGVINNLRLTKEMFAASYDQVTALLKTFFHNGGVQLNLCCIGREDLENAMAHPEAYQNLMVRIGGFSARFVTLEPSTQREILRRTTYGA